MINNSTSEPIVDYLPHGIADLVKIALEFQSLLGEAKRKLEAAERQVAELRADVLAALNTASEERYKLLVEWRDEAEKWEAEGDMYGWNFHQGMAAGANWTDCCYRKIERTLNAARATGERSDGHE